MKTYTLIILLALTTSSCDKKEEIKVTKTSNTQVSEKLAETKSEADKPVLKNEINLKPESKKIYNIKIEFTSVTGALVSKYFWHHSQHFEKNKGNHILTMKCGINRELLGWIFQWMYNIRIVEPAILKEYYDKALDEMIVNRKNNIPFVYRNIFEPKND